MQIQHIPLVRLLVIVAIVCLGVYTWSILRQSRNVPEPQFVQKNPQVSPVPYVSETPPSIPTLPLSEEDAYVPVSIQSTSGISYAAKYVPGEYDAVSSTRNSDEFILYKVNYEGQAKSYEELNRTRFQSEADWVYDFMISPKLQYVCAKRQISGTYGAIIFRLSDGAIIGSKGLGGSLAACQQWLSDTEVTIFEQEWDSATHKSLYLFDVLTAQFQLLEERK